MIDDCGACDAVEGESIVDRVELLGVKAQSLFAAAASKVDVEVADSTYRPADAAFENLEKARDDLIIIIAAEHPRRGVPAVFDH